MSATNWEEVYRVQTARIAELEKENAELRKDYLDMGQTATRSKINDYIGSIIMTDEQRKLRDTVKKELPERSSWAVIQAVCEMVMQRNKEAKQ